jgi:site-specific DNA-methyltransferase (adenine-specific)
LDTKHHFKEIGSILSDSLKISTHNIHLAHGDSLELLKSIPDHCISLILTDPPYHTTKKDNIFGDTSFKEDSHYVEWLSKYSDEWYRILKPNGTLFCFCSSAIAARLEVEFSKKFNILNQIVWTKPNDPGFDGWKQKMKKEALRQWYPHSERIIFAEPSYEGNLFNSYFGRVIYKNRKKSGLSMHQLTAKTGAHGAVNHGGAVSNWEAGRNTPSKDQYEKLRDAILETGKVTDMPIYEDVIRPFKTNGSDRYTDIWDFPSVRPYKNKHPAEKPIELLEHAIKATTIPGDIVLDCFSGSGNTALAASNVGRLTILMEIDSKWVSISKNKLQHKTKTLIDYLKQ